MDRISCPRLLLSSPTAGTGKTLAALGIVLALGGGRRVFASRAGPQASDAQWLAWATGGKPRNLDPFLLPPAALMGALGQEAAFHELVLLEGQGGISDGVGQGSTASLARSLGSPVILVLDLTKVTRTSVAYPLGCMDLEPDLNWAGVILNRAAGSRHGLVARRAVEAYGKMPVLGVIPRIEDLPKGLFSDCSVPQDRPDSEAFREIIRRHVAPHLDVDLLMEKATQAPALQASPVFDEIRPQGARVRVGVFTGPSFRLSYEENREALTALGAEIRDIDPLLDPHLPEVEALYVGDGDLPAHLERLGSNESLLGEVRQASIRGMPIYGEGAGLAYLAESAALEGREVPLAGALSLRVLLEGKEGEGRIRGRSLEGNPFVTPGLEVRGYLRRAMALTSQGEGLRPAMELLIGSGSEPRLGGLAVRNTLALWFNIHALSVPSLFRALVDRAREYGEAISTARSTPQVEPALRKEKE